MALREAKALGAKYVLGGLALSPDAAAASTENPLTFKQPPHRLLSAPALPSPRRPPHLCDDGAHVARAHRLGEGAPDGQHAVGGGQVRPAVLPN